MSEWHKRFFASVYRYPDIEKKIAILRNGVDLARFEGTEERDPHRAIYSSSPDRGLQALLDMWPEIRAQVPDASLHVFYGFYNWRTAAQMAGDEVSLRQIAHLEHLAQNMAGLGVVFHDRVNQRELAREFMRSGVWTYPTWFDETSCITAMEAMAAGCRIVSTKRGGLVETLDGAAWTKLLDWRREDADWTKEPTPEYREEFIREVVAAMKGGAVTIAPPYANSLDTRAAEWDEFLLALAGEMTERIVPKFVDAPEVAA